MKEEQYLTLVYLLTHVLINQERTLTIMSANQDHIDADVAQIADALSGLTAEIEALKAQPGAEKLDFAGLDSIAASVKALNESNATASTTTGETTPGTDLSASVNPSEVVAGTKTDRGSDLVSNGEAGTTGEGDELPAA